MNFRQRLIADEVDKIVRRALHLGFRIFVARAGNYGFYSNKEGTRIVSFQTEGFGTSFSGNYRSNQPQLTGNGWQITESGRLYELEVYLNMHPPLWAIRNAEFKFTTVDQYLATYNDSSHYTEITNETYQPL